MQTTAQSVTATPGRVHTFVAKASQIVPKLDVTLSDSLTNYVTVSSGLMHTVTVSDSATE
jgi:hypothetical protein